LILWEFLLGDVQAGADAARAANGEIGFEIADAFPGFLPAWRLAPRWDQVDPAGFLIGPLRGSNFDLGRWRRCGKVTRA
jgi:hypothetical protein